MNYDDLDYTEIQRRLTFWSRLPRTSDKEMYARHIAWCAYVDARDGLEDGTTEKQNVFRLSNGRDPQLSLFVRH